MWCTSLSEESEYFDHEEDVGEEPGIGGAGAPKARVPLIPAEGGNYDDVDPMQTHDMSDAEWKALHTPTSEWDGCPNCGDRMVIKYASSTDDPPIEFGKMVFTNIWQCHHCWTTTDRIVRIPAG